MKSTLKKVLATTMVTALCATSVVGISGISANAASVGNDTKTSVSRADNFSRDGLHDGSWHGSFNDGTKVRVYLDLANNKATFYFDDGTRIDYNAAFISAISTYKFTDKNGKIAQFGIVERSAYHAKLQCGNRILTLTFDGINE